MPFASEAARARPQSIHRRTNRHRDLCSRGDGRCTDYPARHAVPNADWHDCADRCIAARHSRAEPASYHPTAEYDGFTTNDDTPSGNTQFRSLRRSHCARSRRRSFVALRNGPLLTATVGEPELSTDLCHRAVRAMGAKISPAYSI